LHPLRIMRAFTKSLRVCRPAAQCLSRSFSTAEAVPEEKNEYSDFLAGYYNKYDSTPQHGTILYKYGTLNFLSAVGSILVFKEFYVFDCVAAAGWIPDLVVLSALCYAAGPAISNLKTERALNIDKMRIESYQVKDELINVQLNEITALEAQSPALEEFVGEYKSLLQEAASAQQRIAQEELRAASIDKLELLLNKKTAEAAVAGNVDNELIMDHVYQSFEESANQAKSIDEAIKALKSGKDSTALLDSIVADYKKSPKFTEDREAKLAAFYAAKKK